MLAVLALVQMPWTANLPERGFAIDALRPKFSSGETSLTSAALYLSGRLPVGEGLSLRLEVPYAHLDESGLSSSTFGNPYIGLEATHNRVTFDLGFRPALTSDNELGAIIGIYSDITRLAAFTPHLATLSGRVNYRHQTSAGTTFELGFGPSVWIPTAGGDKEVILDHYGSVGYRGSKVWFALGLGGLLILTENQGSFGERTLYQLGASVGLSSGSVRPALHAILPLDQEIKNNMDFAIGLGVAFPVK